MTGGAAPAGSPVRRATGRALAGLVALPDRLLLVLFWTCLVVAAATTADVFRPAVVLPAVAALVLASWRLAPVPHRAQWTDVVATVAVLGGVAAWVVANAPYAATAFLPLRDPGLLTLSAAWLSENPSPSIDPGGALDVDLALPDVYAGGPLSLNGGLLRVQGSPVLPGLLATVGWVKGVEGVVVADLLLGGAALLGVFALARRLAGSLWALLPTAALATSLPMLAFSRGAYTEPVVAALVLGGLVMAWSGLTARRVAHLALSGAMVASAGLVRIDGAAVLAGLVLGTALAAGAATLPRVRSRLRTGTLLMVPCAAVVLALGLLGLRRHSPGYLESLGPQVTALLSALVGALVVGGLLVVLPLGRLRRAVLRRRRGLAVAVGVLAASVAVVLVTRPLWLVERNTDPATAYASVVTALQAAAGLPEDPSRSYDEHTVTWIAWYLGWPAVVLGLGGLALMAAAAVRRRDPRLLVVAAVVAAPTLLYLVRMSITPDHVWAMRRFLPVTLPGLLVLGTWLLAEAWRWAGRPAAAATAAPGASRSRARLWARWPVRAVAVAAGLVVAGTPATTWGPVVRSVEYSGQLGQLRTVCAELERVGADRVVHVNSGVPYLAGLRMVCDVEVLEVRAAPTVPQLRRILHRWEGDGAVALVAFDDRLVPWSAGPPPPLHTTRTEIWEQTLVRVPHETVGWEQTVWVGTVRDDGLVDAT